MAQNGDTITYTYSDGTSVSEDVSNVDEAVVDYCYSAGGELVGGSSGGSGGAVENVKIDLSTKDTLYLWVSGGSGDGRYEGETFYGDGGGSTEIAFVDTDNTDTDDADFLVGAGGGGGGWEEGAFDDGAGGGARGGTSYDSALEDAEPAQGIAPPQGGDGAVNSFSSGSDGDGAVDDQNRGYIIDSGTATVGGGSGQNQDGEIQISYAKAPSAPTNVQITDDQTEDELTLDWDAVADATSYNVYRAQASGSSKADYTLVAEPTSPPYTDTGLEDGEKYYYRVTSES